MIYLLLPLLLCSVSSTHIWYQGRLSGPQYRNIVLEKNEPLILPPKENLTIGLAKGSVIYSNSLSQLQVTNLHLFGELDRVEPRSLCSSPTLRKLHFELSHNVKLVKDMFSNCEKLEELVLGGDFYNYNKIDDDVFQVDLPNLKNLILGFFKIENLTRSYFEKAPALEYLTIRYSSVAEFDTAAFTSLSKLKKLEILEVPEIGKNPQSLLISGLSVKNLVVTGINGSLSSRLLSQLRVPEVHLNFDHLEDIEPSVCSSSSVKRFELIFKGNNTISKDIFRNCGNLEKLAVTGNLDYVNRVEEDAFENLSNLTSLSLSALKIEHITRNYVKNLPKLEVLHLVDLQVREIDENAFNDLKLLKSLSISRNKNLTHIPEKLFAETSKLESLVMFENHFQNFSWNEFKGLSLLKTLCIRHNKISSFSADKIAENLPNLNHFDFLGNDVDCEKLQSTFINELVVKLGHQIKIFCVERYEMFLFDFAF